MSPSTIPVTRLPVKFESQDNWVLSLPFLHGGATRVRSVFRRVAALSEEHVQSLLNEVLSSFSHRHYDLQRELEANFKVAAALDDSGVSLDLSRQQLLGAYFTMEYSIAGAALFNPSIVAHPNQHEVPTGGLRFIMSLRATGEGHMSSVVFRTGIIHEDGLVAFDPLRRHPRRAKFSPDQFYVKTLFRRKLLEMRVDTRAVDMVMNRLPDRFTLVQLEHAIAESRRETPQIFRDEQTVESIRWLAKENYRLTLPENTHISEVVIFPQSDNERRGIEDLRMVRFVDDDTSVTYYGTYTAYDGFRALPQLMETSDLQHIQAHTLNGAAAKNKGMALFPRRIGGHYVMCSRIDGENMFISYSDIPQFWETAEVLRGPKHPWEFMQMGNCGSPLETSEGWLLLTHGVGPMRSYSIGAMLLDRDDPLKVIGHLDQPLLTSIESEREGYTPNVVYSCGSLIHEDVLYIPYAMSDKATGCATVTLETLLNRLLS